MRITVDKVAAPKFKQNLAGLGDRMDAALLTAANMAASMIENLGQSDIKQAGNFGARWTEGLHVHVEGSLGNMRIGMTHDISYAGIFETGGEISGHPLMWIPLSGVDRTPNELLFSVQARSGRPLLFSVIDRLPKYFGIETVKIPQKFHLREVQRTVMAGFRQIFDAAFRAAR